jgi:hypothetical protein
MNQYLNELKTMNIIKNISKQWPARNLFKKPSELINGHSCGSKSGYMTSLNNRRGAVNSNIDGKINKIVTCVFLVVNIVIYNTSFVISR